MISNKALSSIALDWLDWDSFNNTNKMDNSLLTVLFLSLNPRLLDEPPSCIEVTKDDMCYAGIPCHTLQDGQRCVVGSW